MPPKPAATKKCKKCEREFLRTTEFFYRHRDHNKVKKDGSPSYFFVNICKSCSKKEATSWINRNRPRHNFNQRKNWPKSAEQIKDWLFEKKYKRNYHQELVRQSGLCKLCHKPEHEGARFHGDHNHKCCPETPTCGKCFRGLIHGQCNTFIGLANEDPILLMQAIEYLSNA